MSVDKRASPTAIDIGSRVQADLTRVSAGDIGIGRPWSAAGWDAAIDGEELTGVSNHAMHNDATSDEIISAVRELISLMGKGGITELDLSTGDVSIRLRGATSSAPAAAHQRPGLDGADGAGGNDAEEPAGHEVTSPMIGTFYAAPGPGEAPFVQIGDEVEVGQVVGIVEAMKIMNEIIADRPGVVIDILVQNAQAVEYGSPLLRLGEQTDFVG